VRRAFLCGDYDLSWHCFDHRKAWPHKRFRRLSEAYLCVSSVRLVISGCHVAVACQNFSIVVGVHNCLKGS